MNLYFIFQSCCTGNICSVQRFRSVIPILNITHLKNLFIHPVRVQYHGMGCCWSFDSSIVGFSPKGMASKNPSELLQNEARRASRFFLSETTSWRFHQHKHWESFGSEILHNGIPFFFLELKPQKGEQLKGLISFDDTLKILLSYNSSYQRTKPFYKELDVRLRSSQTGEKYKSMNSFQLPNSDLRRLV